MYNFWCNYSPLIIGFGSALIGGFIGWFLRNKHIQEIQEQIEEKDAAFTHLQNANEMLSIQQESLQSTNMKLSAEYSVLEQKHENLSANFTKLDIDKSALAAQVFALNNEKVNSEELNTAAFEWEQKHNALLQTHEAREARISRLESLILQWEQNHEELSNEIEARDNRIEELTKNNSQWELAFNQLDKEQELYKDEIHNLDKNIVSLKAEYEEKLSSAHYKTDDNSKIIAELETTNKHLTSEIEIIKASTHKNTEWENKYNEIVVAYQGFYEKYRKLLESQKEDQLHIEDLEKTLVSYRLVNAETETNTLVVNIPTDHDDLKIVEGIGPKIETVLNNAGIFTFAQLAQTDPERINAILDAAGSRFKLHNPTTWPTQADLAAKNDWDKLKALQDELIGGRDTASA